MTKDDMTLIPSMRDAIDIVRNECARIMRDIPLNIDACDAFEAIAVIMNRCAMILHNDIDDAFDIDDDAINHACIVICDFIDSDIRIDYAFHRIMN